MRHRYFTHWRNTLRWGYRLSIKQLLAFIGYSVVAYIFLLGFWLALAQVIAFTPLMEYLTADIVTNSSIWVTCFAQALVGDPSLILHAIKTVIWLFTTAPHGQCGDTRYYTDTSHHPGTNHASYDSTSTISHSSHHDSCSSDSGSGGDCDSSSSD